MLKLTSLKSLFALGLLVLFFALPLNALPQKSGAGTQGKLIAIRGKRLYVETAGPEDAPVLLYLHGGPGAGSYDFMLQQGERLARRLRVVAVDQRGALRSDAISEHEPFVIQDLIEDCEALRKTLGVRRWTVLGHSFGGYLALLYAVAYPEAVEALVFESPTFDLASSMRAMLRGAAAEYEAMELPDRAEACRRAADSGEPVKNLWQAFSELTGALGKRRNNLYVHGPEKDFFERLVGSSPFPGELWQRQWTFQHKLFTEGRMFESLLPQLSKVDCPALLLKGKYDDVASDDQVQAFMRQVRKARLEIFQNSSHFPRFEEPERYAQAVTRFVTENALRPRQGTS